MELKAIADFISQIGFPVFVALYLLIRTDRLLRDTTSALRELTSVIRAHLPRKDQAP